LNRLFRILPLRFLGNMSYSYYLIHGVALQGVALLWGMRWRHGAPSVPAFTLGFFAGFAATWLAATALFLLVEKPFSLGRATLPKGSKL
jgi:peptidoglycan/LPS O-acetylase OafA/YrhL